MLQTYGWKKGWEWLKKLAANPDKKNFKEEF